MSKPVSSISCVICWLLGKKRSASVGRAVLGKYVIRAQLYAGAKSVRQLATSVRGGRVSPPASHTGLVPLGWWCCRRVSWESWMGWKLIIGQLRAPQNRSLKEKREGGNLPFRGMGLAAVTEVPSRVVEPVGIWLLCGCAAIETDALLFGLVSPTSVSWI